TSRRNMRREITTHTAIARTRYAQGSSNTRHHAAPVLLTLWVHGLKSRSGWPAANMADCVHVDISRHARRRRAWFGNADSRSLWRAGATSILGNDFSPANALEEPVVGQDHGRFTNCVMME